MKNLFPLLLFLYFSGNAQQIKLFYGDLHGLKGQYSYDIKFEYDSLIIGRDKPEDVYLNEIKQRWEEKKPGKGAAFVKLWFDDRKRLYEPSFVQMFERYSNVKLNDKDAKYTLILKTKNMEGGWAIMPISMHGGEIAGELWIVESADNNKVKAKINFYKVRGEDFYGGDFDMTNRIKSAYMIGGKFLGFFVKKKSKLK